MVRVRRNYYKVCEYCGARLDPGEKCDCQKKKNELRKVRKVGNE